MKMKRWRKIEIAKFSYRNFYKQSRKLYWKLFFVERFNVITYSLRRLKFEQTFHLYIKLYSLLFTDV